MKKFIYVLFNLIIFVLPNLNAQTFIGNAILQTQAQIDAFNYTQVNGRLIIEESISGNITNLEGLSKLKVVTDFVTINNNQALANLNGLSNLDSIGGSLLFILDNHSLTNIDSLSNLKGKFSVHVGGNPNLLNINGLSGITQITDGDIVGNLGLLNINGLSNVTQIGRVYITGNLDLLNINGLSNVTQVGNLLIQQNSSLLNVDGLSSLVKVSGGQFESRISILENPALVNLNGLSNLKSFVPPANGKPLLNIRDNVSLTKYCGLYNLFNSGFDGNLHIVGNGKNPTPAEIISNGPCDSAPLSSSNFFIANLLGKNVTPPVITSGSGGGMFVLNSTQDTLEFWIRICSLGCPLTKANFELGAPGINGFPIKQLTPYLVADTMGYLAHGFWTSSDQFPPFTPAIAANLLAGNISINVYTQTHPHGEIKGQLTFNQPVELFANLDGLQETPPNMSNGNGTGTFLLSGDGDSLSYLVTENNLSAPVTAAHFHKAAFGVPGPVVKPISFNNQVSMGFWTNTDAQPLTPSLVADLLGCNLYVNVHTTNFPAGEIRGQLYKKVDNGSTAMTVWGTRNDEDKTKNSKLINYSLEEGKSFENIEGEIGGYTGDKNIVSFTMDIGGNFYFLNNTWASMLYRISPDQVDFNASTPLTAKQIGRIRTSDGTPVNVSNIKFIGGKLYGIDNKTNKLYDISPFDASVREVALLASLENKSAGLVSAADGSVYVLKNSDESKSELFKFNKFPGVQLTFISALPAGIGAITSHPNGNFYAADKQSLYEVNLKNKTVGILSGYQVSVSGIDFDYAAEKKEASEKTLQFETISGLTGMQDFTSTPKEYNLEQNYPNPFNPSTSIRYSIPLAGFVKLSIYNILGQKVMTLANESKEAGTYNITFNSNGLSSGMYIYKLEAGSYTATHKMVLLK